MKILAIAAVVILSVLAAGCGSQAAVVEKKCDLVSLKVKQITLKGDTDGFVATAVAQRLFSRGAKLADDGVTLTGSVQLGMGAASGTLNSNWAAIAAVADVDDFQSFMAGENANASRLADKLADQVCECVLAHPPKPRFAK